jgi:uncharacterized membrane protein YdjX (TVP38/TMEM64 family)
MRAVLVKTFFAIAVVLVLLSVLGFVFEHELELFAQWIADRLGFTGLCAILLVTDTVVTPFPPDVLLIVIAKSAFAQDWPFYVGILGSSFPPGRGCRAGPSAAGSGTGPCPAAVWRVQV